MSREILYMIMISCGIGSVLALGYAQYHLYKAKKYFDKAYKKLNQNKDEKTDN
jgi:hypothetical protein